MRNSIILIITFYIFGQNTVNAQKHDHTWILGYQSNNFSQQQGWGLKKYTFEQGNLIGWEWLSDSLNHFPYLFDFTATIMSDAEGELVFYYNGFQNRDRFNQVPVGGDTLNEYWFWNTMTGNFNNGMPIQQSSLALPIPESDDEYLIMSTTADINYINIGRVIADKIFVHRVQRTETGLDVQYSNNTILNGDRLTPVGLTALRHANGRDWWIMFGRVAENLEYLEGLHQYLLTPEGLEYWQYIEFDFPVHGLGSGQFCYNRDGSLFIMAVSRLYTLPFSVVIMQFDRCTGDLSHFIQHTGPELGHGGNSCIVSPNNRYLYVSNLIRVYQYDLMAEDIFDSEVIIGQVDTLVGTPYFITVARNGQLAPDGRIYFANGSSTTALNIIHYPDSGGLASGFEHDGFPLGVYNFRTIPNLPNYCLGALEGSPCDTLGLPYNYCKTDSIVSVQEVLESEMGNLTIYPNPTHSMATVQIPGPGRLALYDLQGRLLRQETIAAHQMDSPTAHELQINTNTLPGGMYMLVFYSEDGYVYRGKLGVVP